MSGDILVAQLGECYWHLMDKWINAAKHYIAQASLHN